MELVTGMPQMHATDVVAVVQPSGHIACSNFNVVVNKGYLGTVRASVDMNERTTDLILIHDQQAGCFLFPGGKLTPEPQMLSSLPLSIGRNRMEFRVLDNSSGDRICVSADLWLYHSDDRIVVMDVDGTITKSDVRGLVASQFQATTSFLSNALTASTPWSQDIATTFNTDYTHDGVAEALTHISDADYRILYLTARPITLADKTREFLASVGRSQNASLPEGPMVTQPCGTMKALQTKHDAFKTQVLTQIRELFTSAEGASLCGPPRSEPIVFAAGFGNTETDIMAYTAAGIPPSHIFVLDKASVLKVLASGQELQSYRGLMHLLPVLLPPLRRDATSPLLGLLGRSAPSYASIYGKAEVSTRDARAGQWSASELMDNILPGVRELSKSCSPMQMGNLEGRAEESETARGGDEVVDRDWSRRMLPCTPESEGQSLLHSLQHRHSLAAQRADAFDKPQSVSPPVSVSDVSHANSRSHPRHPHPAACASAGPPLPPPRGGGPHEIRAAWVPEADGRGSLHTQHTEVTYSL